MFKSFSRTTSGRIAIITSGVVLLSIAVKAFGHLPLWNPILMMVPMFAGMVGIAAVGLAIAEEHYGVGLALIFGYPFLGMFYIVGTFGAERASTLQAGIVAVVGVVCLAVGVMSGARGGAQQSATA